MTTVRNMLCLLCASILLGTALMIGVYALPTGAVREHLQSSIDMLAREGQYPSWAETHHPSGLYSKKDGFTDALMMQNALYRGPGSVIDDAMLNPHITYEDLDPADYQIHALSRALNRERGQAGTYARYWHGYLLYLKPLLMLMNVSGLRVLNLVLQFMLLVAVLLRIYVRLGRPYVYAFAATVLFLDPITMVLCFQLADVYYITLITMLVMLSRNDWLNQRGRYYYLFLLNGIAVAFFDFLTYPFVALGVPTVLYLLLNPDAPTARKVAGMFKLACAWGLGYLGMWAGKWGMAYLLTGHNIIWESINHVRYRLSGSTYDWGPATWQTLWARILSRGYSATFKNILILLCAALFIIAAALLYLKRSGRRRLNISANETLPLGLASLYSLLWYAVVTQHSLVHYFFTYRELAISLFALLCILIRWIVPRKKTGPGQETALSSSSASHVRGTEG